MFTIENSDLITFVKICAQLVEEGKTFNANSDTLTITLTGGF